MEEKNMKELNLDEMDKVSGGKLGAGPVWPNSCPKCNGIVGQEVTCLGRDAHGRITYYRCQCGCEYSVIF